MHPESELKSETKSLQKLCQKAAHKLQKERDSFFAGNISIYL